MSSTRETALVAGVLFLITDVSAIAGVLLYGPALSDAHYVTGTGADARCCSGRCSTWCWCSPSRGRP